jgi:hypothetical protein
MIERIKYPFEPLGSLSSLCRHLGVQRKDLLRIANSAGESEYRVVGREESHSSSIPAKIIYEPKPRLRELQQRLNELIFRRVSYPSYIVGGVPGGSVRGAVSKHMYARSLMSFDVVRFFESASEKIVRRSLQLGLGFSPEVAGVLTAVTTVNGHLPRGAPTSTYLANLIFFSDEPALVEWLGRFGHWEFRYTRWIDDMTITSREPITAEIVEEVTGEVARLLRRRDLRFQRERGTRLEEREKRRVVYDAPVVHVHSIEVRGDQLSASKKIRRQVKAGVHGLELASETGPLNDHNRIRLASLTGRVGYLQHFHPEEMSVLKRRLARVRLRQRRFDEHS